MEPDPSANIWREQHDVAWSTLPPCDEDLVRIQGEQATARAQAWALSAPGTPYPKAPEEAQ